MMAIAIPGPRVWAEPGQWQSGGVFSAPGDDLAAASRFLLLDTGGSGGMFGKGDLRGDLRDVAFLGDGRVGVASGGAGAFLTEDGGLSWRRIRPHPRHAYPDLKGIQYNHVGLDEGGHIWLAETRHPAIGRSLWHSADAGATWDDMAARLPGPLDSLWDLFVRGEHVLVLGGWKPESSYRSADGGRTWQRMALPEGFEPYRAATPASEPADELRTVYLLGAQRRQRARIPRLLRSDDGGSHWREIPLPDPERLPWAFSRATIAFATPDQGMIGLQASGLDFIKHGQWQTDPDSTAGILVTANGGETWVRRALPADELFITTLWQDPADPDHAFAGVWNGFVAQHGMPRNGTALYETLDGGRTWATALRGGLQINAIFALSRDRFWAVGDRTGFSSNDVVAILTRSGGRQ
jgi:photosystem II stability/assembly factor-like uncharacterized protein